MEILEELVEELNGLYQDFIGQGENITQSSLGDLTSFFSIIQELEKLGYAVTFSDFGVSVRKRDIGKVESGRKRDANNKGKKSK